MAYDAQSYLPRVVCVQFVHLFTQSGFQAPVVQNFRVKIHGQLAHVMQRMRDQLAQVLEALSFLGVRRLLQQLQIQQNRGQGLSDFIMQLSGNPLALFFVSVNDLLR